MRIIMKISIVFTVILTIPWNSECFMPSKLLDSIISKLNVEYHSQFDKVSHTVTHDEIAKRGAIRSIAQYFYDQENNTKLIDMKIANEDGYTIESLYKIYFNANYCFTGASKIIIDVFMINAALPDLDKKTKDMPYAHFDAETFIESNRRVINFTNNIFTNLDQGHFLKAQELTGQILHTIQDFYSHSNWVEAGNTDINYAIGTEDFGNLTVVGQNESDCISNCTLRTAQCNKFVQELSDIFGGLGFDKSLFKCPLHYYECHGNIKLFTKLVSGFYSNQKLNDGTPVPKPSGLKKCSHGGILDGTSSMESIGGINKDTGYYILSPHADLHLMAVSLATQHSAYFFNKIRKHIGDEKFAEFMGIPHGNIKVCSSSSTIKYFHFNIVFIFMYLILFYYLYNF